jgi:F0F1-type ATP synthase membrane subunit b/b'
VNHFLFITIILLAASLGLANEHAATEGMFPTVFWTQVINFVPFVFILCALNWYFEISKKYFIHKKEQFLTQQKLADEALRIAKGKRDDVQARLTKLINTTGQSIKSTHQEGEMYKAKLVNDAEAVHNRLTTELRLTQTAEVKNAVAALKDKLVNDAIGEARSLIKTQVAESDLKRLQKEFVEKIQVVNQ